ncbi:mechanosensitive ion channel [Acetobacterium bakii]|uniref:Membrane protein n=1 Tax=Acetobacterium bakii TaxID=52689 RepID=A0A0L6U060_9FIRM|nr:mechanosensitive ion channel [Acetobacterium bakii]KNZ41868.1 membrane protein [Acetobacterium bakii]
MDQIQNTTNSLWNSFNAALPGVIGAIVLLIIAILVALLVKFLVNKGLHAIKFNVTLVKWKVAATAEDGTRLINSIAKILFYLVLLSFVPAILVRLGLGQIADPIINMYNSFLAFLPNLFAAIVILVIGYFVAKFVRELVQAVLEAINIDRFVNKYTVDADTTPQELRKQKNTLAKVLANTVFVIILIPIVTIALETLRISTLSTPIVNVLNQILAALPFIIVAVIILVVGGYIAKIVGNLVEGLLENSGVNKYSKYLNMSGTASITISEIVGTIVKVVLMTFFIVEAINTLQLQVLNTIGIAIIAYLPSVLIAIIILGFGVFGGNALSTFIKKTTGSALTGELVKYIIYILAIFMTLDQLKFASTIVTTTFLFIIGGLSIAFALAFGLGGREFAKYHLGKFSKKIDKETAKTGTENPPDDTTKFKIP